MAIRGGRGTPKKAPKRNHRTGPRSDYRRVKNWKPSFKKMWVVVSDDVGEVFRKDITCLEDVWLELKYGDEVQYQILRQESHFQQEFFWRWYVRNQDGEESVWTIFKEDND